MAATKEKAKELKSAYKNRNSVVCKKAHFYLIVVKKLKEKRSVTNNCTPKVPTLHVFLFFRKPER